MKLGNQVKTTATKREGGRERGGGRENTWQVGR